jgi:Icc-related predicted phosphoesterase
MRIVATADIHGFLPEVPPCDVLVVAGDLTPTSDHDVRFQARWLDTAFREWLERVPAAHVVAVAGNHDFVFERAADSVPDLPWQYLNDTSCTIDGVRFWGSPWTPWFFDWAFNAPRDDADERFLTERYATCPADADVVVLHGPPAGFGDHTNRGADVGSTAALALLGRVRPQVCVYGHIHEGRGAWELDGTDLANVSYVDSEYRPVDAPLAAYDVTPRRSPPPPSR